MIEFVGISIYYLSFSVITFSIFFKLSVSTKVVVIPFLLGTFSINLKIFKKYCTQKFVFKSTVCVFYNNCFSDSTLISKTFLKNGYFSFIISKSSPDSIKLAVPFIKNPVP